MSIVTLVSGGIDSSLLALLIKEQGIPQFPLFVDYGQLSLQQEWAACKAFHKQHDLSIPKKVNLSGFGKTIISGITCNNLDVKNNAFLPGRNFLFLLAGSSYAYQKEANAVAIGLLNEDVSIFPDQTSEFLEAAQGAIARALGKNIKILAPLMTLNKGDILELAKLRSISNTYSCHSGNKEPCGVCISCLEMLHAKEEKGEK
ncbi:MAG: 7-cyano-7-deazaguanine synthase [Syntrophaceae bacterium]